MGRKCFVPYCKSGYNTCQDVVAMFSCPNDPVSLKLWSEAIARQDRPLRSTDCICEKHFREEDILRSWIAYDKSGKEIMRVNYKRIRLRDGSVPCFFPKSKNIYSRKRRKSDDENDDKNSIIPQVNHVFGVYPSDKILDRTDYLSDALDEKLDDNNCGTSTDEDCSVDSPEINESHDDSDIEDERRHVKIIKSAKLFESIWQDINIITLPSKSWAVFLLRPNGDRKIVFTQMGFLNGVPLPTKQASKFIISLR
ncbi:hypothetical protein J437_LFUL004189 [Ladona fulva]|uniref:THAP-type domain-containing protein n=1 Tax=Ladona fulva TaxID=123851 RepID=A0A8K0NXW8_LADFU|nr:hypothetical protein J437_LFUL004189 [Ladona fulva]